MLVVVQVSSVVLFLLCYWCSWCSKCQRCLFLVVGSCYDGCNVEVAVVDGIVVGCGGDVVDGVWL